MPDYLDFLKHRSLIDLAEGGWVVTEAVVSEEVGGALAPGYGSYGRTHVSHSLSVVYSAGRVRVQVGVVSRGSGEVLVH